jgi:hypothetical protein
MILGVSANISEAQSCCAVSSPGVTLDNKLRGTITYGAKCKKGGSCTPIPCTNYQIQAGVSVVSGSYGGSYEVVTMPHIGMNYCGPAPIVEFCETVMKICGEMRLWVGIPGCAGSLPEIPGVKPMFFRLPYGKSSCVLAIRRRGSSQQGTNPVSGRI